VEGAYAGPSMPSRRIAIATAAVAALAAGTGGCGEARNAGGRAASTSPTPVGAPASPIGKAVASVGVSLVDYRLQPANAHVARRGVIAFVATNDGQTEHALAVDGPAGTVRTVTLRPGERTTLLVRLPPGTYKWLCPIADHAQRGMVGHVRVAE
jgi:uncharacterized cupredoxin-like copper-binding protein